MPSHAADLEQVVEEDGGSGAGVDHSRPRALGVGRARREGVRRVDADARRLWEGGLAAELGVVQIEQQRDEPRRPAFLNRPIVIIIIVGIIIIVTMGSRRTRVVVHIARVGARDTMTTR